MLVGVLYIDPVVFSFLILPIRGNNRLAYCYCYYCYCELVIA